MKKPILLLILLIVIAPLFYYTITTFNARRNTTRIVQDTLNSDKIKLKLNDLNEEQKNILLLVEDPNFYKPKGLMDMYYGGNTYRKSAKGYAIGSGNSIPDYVPVEGYLAMIDAVKEIRRTEK